MSPLTGGKILARWGDRGNDRDPFCESVARGDPSTVIYTVVLDLNRCSADTEIP